MKCIECGSATKKDFTTDVTEINKGCLLIIKNVPCYKCTECNEVIYTADVVACLEKIKAKAKDITCEISVIDYSKVA